MGRNIRASFWIAQIILALAAPALADHFVLKDNKTIDGDVLKEDDRTVTLEVQAVGTSLTQHLDKSRIKTWARPSHEGQPYIVLPILGEIGNDVTTAAVRAGITEARNAQPKYLVLAIDSPGGSIQEMVGIIDAINEVSKDIPTIAYVRHAYSAAAVIAMSCPQIYMKPEATIGATVPFRMTDDGPRDVDAKFRSVIEARMRATSTSNGHADLFIRGMSELDLELFLADEDGAPTLRNKGPGKQIKSKGQILTLTAAEASDCGLALLSPDMTDLGKQVCGGVWHEVNKRAWNATLNTVTLNHRRQRQEIEDQLSHLNRARIADNMRPQLDNIVRRYRELRSTLLGAKLEASNIVERCHSELRQADAEYQVKLRQCTSTVDATQATQAADARAAQIRNSYTARLETLKSNCIAAQKEMAGLEREFKDKLATLPQD